MPTTSTRCCIPHFAEKGTSIAKGLGASPGAAVGRVYFTANDAEAAASRGEPVILVRSETSPEDVHGMMVAEGILTVAVGSSATLPSSPADGARLRSSVPSRISISGKSFTASGIISEGGRHHLRSTARRAR